MTVEAAVSIFQTAVAIPMSIPSNAAVIISCSVNEIASVVPTGSGLLRNDGGGGSLAAPTTIRHCEAVSFSQTAEAIPISVPSNTAAIISCGVNEIASVVPTTSSQ